VLDISVPSEKFDDLLPAIVHEWPSYLAYATSFLTIGGIWLAHHSMFHRLAYVNRQVMRLNLLLLMAVSFLPFPTRLVAEAVRNTDAERTAVIFYGLSLFVISTLIGALWGVIAQHRELLRPGVTDAEVNAILLRATPNIGFYALGTVVAIVAPHVAAFGYLVIAVSSVLLARGDIAPASAPGAPTASR
jgi:uncharacterized membrane protein